MLYITHHYHLLAFYISIIFIFVLSFLYEGILNCRSWFDQFCRVTNNNINSNSKVNVINTQFTIGQQIIRACLHAFCACYSLIMMMIFMTFNGWFCTAIILGTLFGYLFFNIWIPEPDSATLNSRPRTCC
jgi:hypothetical protein